MYPIISNLSLFKSYIHSLIIMFDVAELHLEDLNPELKLMIKYIN